MVEVVEEVVPWVTMPYQVRRVAEVLAQVVIFPVRQLIMQEVAAVELQVVVCMVQAEPEEVVKAELIQVARPYQDILALQIQEEEEAAAALLPQAILLQVQADQVAPVS
jgi:CRISPR/Cas system CMR subunit Cmr4 (Cas7 group RAMP superfamily)